MKRLIIASALVASLVLGAGAPAHGDENHGKKKDQRTDGHATALGKPGGHGRQDPEQPLTYGRSGRYRGRTGPCDHGCSP